MRSSGGKIKKKIYSSPKDTSYTAKPLRPSAGSQKHTRTKSKSTISSHPEKIMQITDIKKYQNAIFISEEIRFNNTRLGFCLWDTFEFYAGSF